MTLVLIVDTSVFMNILNIPGFNQNHKQIIEQLASYLKDSTTILLLPMAAIIEAGNHIAQLKDGRLRRKYAEIFAEQVANALDGSAPWQPTAMPDAITIRSWLPEYPDRAMGEVGMGDLSIIKEWEAVCARHPRHSVRIWSLDRHLKGFNRLP